MLVITDIVFKEVNNDYYEEITSRCNPLDDYKYIMSKEILKGKKFVNDRNEVVIISMKKEIQDILGLPFESFNKMKSKEIELKKEINQLINQLIKKIKIKVFYID